MSTLTEQIAEAFEAHTFDKGIALCRCGAKMDAFGHRTREHRAHLATVTAAVVAEWLGSDEAANAVADRLGDWELFDDGDGPGEQTNDALAALAAEARRWVA